MPTLVSPFTAIRESVLETLEATGRQPGKHLTSDKNALGPSAGDRTFRGCITRPLVRDPAKRASVLDIVNDNGHPEPFVLYASCDQDEAEQFAQLMMGKSSGAGSPFSAITRRFGRKTSAPQSARAPSNYKRKQGWQA